MYSVVYTYITLYIFNVLIYIYIIYIYKRIMKLLDCTIVGRPV